MGLGSMIARRKVRAAWAAMSQDHIDTDNVFNDWADDVVWDGSSDLGVGQSIKGKVAIADWFRRWEQEFPHRKLVPKNVCMKGTFLPNPNNVAMVDWTCTETDRQGREYTYEGVTVAHFKGGKIVRASDYISFAGLPQLSTLLKPTAEA